MGHCCSTMEKSLDKPIKWYPGFCETLPSLKGKVAAITGTTTGTGNTAAKTCAEKGATVLLLNRTSERAIKSLEDLKAKVPNGQFVAIPCDLQDSNSVRQAAAQIKATYSQQGLDVLCCNAGIMAMPDEATKEGFDTQMQTNHLSHWLLSAELFPLLVVAGNRTGDARLVFHSSSARKGGNGKLEAKYFGKNGGNLGGDGTGIGSGGRWVRYTQTKLANIVCTYALADRVSAAGLTKVKITCAEPGLASTNLQLTTKDNGGMSAGMVNLLFGNTGQSAEDGMMPLLAAMAATDAANGDFYVPSLGGGFKGPPKKIKREKRCNNEENKKILLEESVKAFGVDIVIG